MSTARFSRRKLLKQMAWAPFACLPAPLATLPASLVRPLAYRPSEQLPDLDFTVRPHYPAASPLEDVLSLVNPRADRFPEEQLAFEFQELLDTWSGQLLAESRGGFAPPKFLDAAVAGRMFAAESGHTRSGGQELFTFRRKAAASRVFGQEVFLQELAQYFADFRALDRVSFAIVRIQGTTKLTNPVESTVRYEFAGDTGKSHREQRIGNWEIRWSQRAQGQWFAVEWNATEEAVATASGPVFADISSNALGQIPSYRDQLLRGVDQWRTVLDGACNLDVYGNNGIAAGDYDNDGWDDLYICQPAGLPNRLYRNRGDGTFEDVTDSSGVGLLDGTACALFADFRNSGLQDLLVVTANGPLLFLNSGKGNFSLKADAFQFARPPQGTFTHAAAADYDQDGRLDVYFCLYSYYLGLDQYHYPSPYFDARNGPPNFLFHNQGDGRFEDRTQAAGLDAENDRFSFACAWGDCDADGRPDLYVANDFGRSNLYRNNGDGTFSPISHAAGVDEVGAGMSACWADFGNDGRQDIYVSNMWSAAGQRVAEQASFQEKTPREIHALYRRHARGNSLYKNFSGGRFKNLAETAGVEMGGWAWSADAWDFDHDGFSDLYITNGYISGPETPDIASFFWRRVVGASPSDAVPSIPYEQGWNAINELIRSDHTWSGYERNVLYRNNGDGTFSNVSAVSGLDFLDDSRAFALADLDHDGRLEIILKNRTAPQIRILRNVMSGIGDSIGLRLRGSKSNRDAIGAAVSLQCGELRQTKLLQCGSGFLSQHGKELFFGLGKSQAPVTATVRWPSGLTQVFQNLPRNHRVTLEEGSPTFAAKAFSPAAPDWSKPAPSPPLDQIAGPIETWLVEPLRAPDFTLPDSSGKSRSLGDFRGTNVLLTLWAAASRDSVEQLQHLQRSFHELDSRRLQVIAVNVDEPADSAAPTALLNRERFPFTTLFATPDFTGVYNIFFRFLFDRRRDISLPVSFLLDDQGRIVKVYQGIAHAVKLRQDLADMPQNDQQRIAKALPFSGVRYRELFQRNQLTYGLALFQRGYPDHAVASFQQALAARPSDPEAAYNLGTLYLRKNALAEAQKYLEQAVNVQPHYPEAWNNLAMIASQRGQTDEAVRDLNKALAQRPDYVTAQVNLGNLYRRQGKIADAEALFQRALQLEPENPEVHYGAGMLLAQQNDLMGAQRELEKAIHLRPRYPEALNNLGILLTQQNRREEAETQFRACIELAPQYDQAYLNLARLYVLQREKDKSRAVLQELLRLQPQHKLAQQALQMLD